MTNREKELLQILRENPMISQNDLADMLKYYSFINRCSHK